MNGKPIRREARGGDACRSREEILAMLGDSFVPCPEDPDGYELEPGLRGAEAIELVSAGTDTVVLGAKVPGLRETSGIPVHGKLFSVFRVRNGRIVAVS